MFLYFRLMWANFFADMALTGSRHAVGMDCSILQCSVRLHYGFCAFVFQKWTGV